MTLLSRIVGKVQGVVMPLLAVALVACDASSELPKSTHPIEANHAQSSRPADEMGGTKGGALKISIPETFSAYTSNAGSDGIECTAGTLTDADGMSQLPAVYLKDREGRVRWVSKIALPANTYQARASNCLRQGERIYVLVQADTQSEQTLSQTLLSVVELAMVDGSFKASRDVVVQDVDGAYSAWVSEENGAFRVEDGNLAVSGLFFRLDAPDQRLPFRSILRLDQ